MSVWLLLMALAVISVVVVLVLVLAGVVGARSGLRPDEKAELVELRDLVARIDRLAYEHREIEPQLAFAVIDEINRSKRTGFG